MNEFGKYSPASAITTFFRNTFLTAVFLAAWAVSAVFVCMLYSHDVVRTGDYIIALNPMGLISMFGLVDRVIVLGFALLPAALITFFVRIAVTKPEQ